MKPAGAIWPNAYSGNAQGGKPLQRHEDLSGPSLEQRHAVGYSTNDPRTREQVQARVKHSEKQPAKMAAKPKSVFNPKGHPKRSLGKSGKTAKAADPGQPVGAHRL